MKAHESCGHPKSFHMLHFFMEVVDQHVYNKQETVLPLNLNVRSCARALNAGSLVEMPPAHRDTPE